ncbi:MAG: hypothetical protein ABI903_02775 [Actinomycetota bacterium]
MPASTRRVAGAVLAAMGIILLVAGAWIIVTLGPSGEARFSATSNAPGTVVVPSDVLNTVDVPVHVTATRGDGGAVRLLVGASADARAILTTSAVSTVNAVHYPAGRLGLHASGAGALGDVSGADVWRLAAAGAGSATLVVDQARAPETMVITSGDSSALKDVTVTLTWANHAWFFEALAMATLGAVLAVFSFNDLWQGRAGDVHGEVAETKTTRAAV